MFAPTKVRHSFAAIATVFAFAGPVTVAPVHAPVPGAATVKNELRNGCSPLVTQAAHRTYAEGVYQRPKITKRAKLKLREFRLCQHSAKAGDNARKYERKLVKERRQRQLIASMGPRGIGLEEAAKRGWTGSEWNCLDALWHRESGWNHRADNPTSDAYGIPQSLPGSKMASAGADWATNPRTQIRWGLGYIAGRYGSPCGAWGHSQSVGWY